MSLVVIAEMLTIQHLNTRDTKNRKENLNQPRRFHSSASEPFQAFEML